MSIKYNNNESNENIIRKLNTNIKEKFLNCINIKNELPIQRSNPIDIKSQIKYDNDLLIPPPNDDHSNNKDFNLLLSRYSISPNTYNNFDFMKYNRIK